MKTTSHYSLKKPDQTDFVNIDDLNANADTIDSTLASLQTEVGGKTSNTGTVTNVSAGNGLSGGSITGSGSLSIAMPLPITPSSSNNAGTVGGGHTHAATGFEPAIPAGTTDQFWRGDKTWQTPSDRFGFTSVIGLSGVHEATQCDVLLSTDAATATTQLNDILKLDSAKHVKFLPGTYNINGVNIGWNSLVEGSGIGATIIQGTTAGFYVGGWDVCIRDMTVKSTSTAANSYSISVVGSRFLLDHVKVVTANGTSSAITTGLNFNHSGDSLIQSCYFSGGYNGILMANGSDYKIRDTEFDGQTGVSVFTNSYGNGQSGSAYSITGCIFINSPSGIGQTGPSNAYSANYIGRWTIMNNVFYNISSMCISFIGTNYTMNTQVIYANIVGNQFKNTAGYGVYLYTLSKAVVCQNAFNGIANGVYLGSRTTNCIVQFNTGLSIGQASDVGTGNLTASNL